MGLDPCPKSTSQASGDGCPYDLTSVTFHSNGWGAAYDYASLNHLAATGVLNAFVEAVSGSRGGGGGATNPIPQNTSEIRKTACTAARIASATKGFLNFGVGTAKIGLAALSGASTPATGPLGGVGLAYFGIGAAGNISAGSMQLIGAITGNLTGTGQAATTATTATSVLGLGALLVTRGNLETASSWANIESLGTAGFNGGMTGHLIDEAATFAQKLFLSAELGQNAADAVGLNPDGTCP